MQTPLVDVLLVLSLANQDSEKVLDVKTVHSELF